MTHSADTPARPVPRAEIDRLRALAEEASKRCERCDGRGIVRGGFGDMTCDECYGRPPAAARELEAACSPDVVLSLLDALDALGDRLRLLNDVIVEHHSASVMRDEYDVCPVCTKHGGPDLFYDTAVLLRTPAGAPPDAR